jgi:5-(carboxyamino)imidazole ribonucleotide synthase
MYEAYDSEIAALSGRIAFPRLGIIGGGQLAKMTAMSALQLGVEVVVLERNSYSPAAQLATHSIVGDWDDPEALMKLASHVDVVSIENEFISTDALAVLEQSGRRLRPGTGTLRLVQDKFVQKETLAAAGLPTPRFAAVHSAGDLVGLAGELGWPLVLKARRGGYDGKGNFTVRSADDAGEAWRALGGERRALYAEEFCRYASELAVIVTRGGDGALVQYPVVETVQRDHICHVVRAPAPVAPDIAALAAAHARRAIEAIDGVGTFGVELFVTAVGAVLINELAPRVHNSGHYTAEACECSQFENHVRAVLGLPLGSPAMVAPAAVMVNLLGTGRGPGVPQGLREALAVRGAHVHVYGKAMSGAGRKMGHVTALGPNVADAESTARKAADCLRFGAIA